LFPKEYFLIIKLYGQLLLMAGLLVAVGGQSVYAAPDGADLLAACNQSLSRGFGDLQGALCIWYITPCDCTSAMAEDRQPVCLPDNVATTVLAETIVKALDGNPELHTMEAGMAAAMILSRAYPCPGQY
jgi:hypothetical protein